MAEAGTEDMLATAGVDIPADTRAEVTLAAAMAEALTREARDMVVMSLAALTLTEVVQLSFIAVRLTAL